MDIEDQRDIYRAEALALRDSLEQLVKALRKGKVQPYQIARAEAVLHRTDLTALMQKKIDSVTRDAVMFYEQTEQLRARIVELESMIKELQP